MPSCSVAMAALYFITVFTLLLLASNAEELTVKPGDDVTVQCPRGEAIRALKLSRPDLKTDDYVFFLRENRPYDHYQHPSFRGRVQLRDPEMKDGDVSVILKNVTINDTGTYECRVSVIGNGLELMNTINLTVSDSGHTAGNTWTEGDKDGRDKDEGKKEAGNLRLTVGLTVTAVFLLAVFVGFVIHRQHKQRRDQQVHYIAAVPQQV